MTEIRQQQAERALSAAFQAYEKKIGSAPLESMRVVLALVVDAALESLEEPCGICAGHGCPTCHGDGLEVVDGPDGTWTRACRDCPDYKQLEIAAGQVDRHREDLLDQMASLEDHILAMRESNARWKKLQADSQQETTRLALQLQELAQKVDQYAERNLDHELHAIIEEAGLA